ncbi:sulfotransferase family protein [Salinibacter ruber]|uniref:Sulfotransferase n=1 Tax=Salinibacter ruber TaxID=146919 RepID=A0A9X2UNL7_9BACT|nr:sulfotransferase [Salinibacter ruber]MCS3613237.1 hypothetical protein [Salinibacter ruber]MCS3616566.1 hypothetical protein [Salinibacter ruber]MCS3675807.1 hypothetical protein [Salinibacter ruber]MCS4037862.1 hypothetical protein [Salinibacter ruber]
MAKPLFVVGKHRSGTTWLGNLLLDHPSIAGLHHERHRGIHESAFFSHVDGRYGDLDVFENYVEFAAVMARSDYFRLAGASFEDLMELYPANYADVFRVIMDRVAEQRDARYWIEKSPMHTGCVRKISDYYTNAQFIGIWRDPVDVAFSWIKRQDERHASQFGRLLALARVTIDKYVVDAHMLDVRSSQPEQLYVVRYEDLVDDKRKVLNGIYGFLDLSQVEVRSGYEANTSYTDSQTSGSDEGANKTKRFKRSSHEEKFIQCLYNWGLPLLSARALIHLKRSLRQNHKSSLPSWFFKLLNESLDEDGSEKSQETDGSALD